MTSVPPPSLLGLSSCSLLTHSPSPPPGWNETSNWDAAPAAQANGSGVHNSRSTPALNGSGGSGAPSGPSSRLNSARDGNTSASGGKAAKPADEDDEWGKW